MTHRASEPLSFHQVIERQGPEGLRRIPFRLAASVAPASTVKVEQPIPRDGTVERVRVRVYAGAELALRITPYVVNEKGQRRDLIVFAGKDYIDGDDDTFEFQVREPVYLANGDKLVVSATNTSATYTYDFAVDIEVDFAGGVWPMWAVVDHQGGGV